MYISPSLSLCILNLRDRLGLFLGAVLHFLDYLQLIFCFMASASVASSPIQPPDQAGQSQLGLGAETLALEESGMKCAGFV